MSLMNDFQACRALKIGVDDHDILCTLLLLVKNISDSLSEDNSVGVDFFGTTDMEVWVGSRSDRVVDCGNGSVKGG